MLIRRLKISGMLSFGPAGIDLPMEPLNVLIGPNGSGKSNFIEALALLRAAPRDLSAPVKRMGGIAEWLWKGDGAPGVAAIDVEVAAPDAETPLRHALQITGKGQRFEVVDERIEDSSPDPSASDAGFYYRFRQGAPVIVDDQGEERGLQRDTVRPAESILSQRGDPDHYPKLHLARAEIRRHPPVPQLGARAGRRPAPVPAGRPTERLPDRTGGEPGLAVVQAAG